MTFRIDASTPPGSDEVVARYIAIFLISAWSVGCGDSQSEREQRSWRATGSFVTSAWRRGALPARYAVDTLRVVESKTHDPEVAATVAAIGRGDGAERP
jgi:hypothetical protein